jgi:hypothetical protein
MRRLGSTSVRLWLIATLFGLSGLLLAGAAQHDGAPVDAFQKDALTAAASEHAAALPCSTEALTPGHLRHASHALLRTPSSATLFNKAGIVIPVFTGKLSPRENVLALGDPPRIPGPSRAPPAA